MVGGKCGLQPVMPLEYEPDSDDGPFCRGCFEFYCFFSWLAFLIVDILSLSLIFTGDRIQRFGLFSFGYWNRFRCAMAYDSYPSEEYDHKYGFNDSDTKSEARPLISAVHEKRVWTTDLIQRREESGRLESIVSRFRTYVNRQNWCQVGFDLFSEVARLGNDDHMFGNARTPMSLVEIVHCLVSYWMK